MTRDKDIDQTAFIMTSESIDGFCAYEAQRDASDNMRRRFICTTKALFEYLPDDKVISKERLLQWRNSLTVCGYSSQTILNYVKYINRYLDYMGWSSIRFNRGRFKDIAGLSFGYLTAIEPTGEKNRKDLIWRCQCKCGNMVELPATRLLLGNTLSCGCLHKDHFQQANKYIANTSLRQALEDNPISSNAISGYTGVTPKRGKWLAYIRYQGKHYSLGVYNNIEDAVKARARAKELVQKNAKDLLTFYEELHKQDPELPSRETEPFREFPTPSWIENSQPGTAAKRSDNRSGHTGVSLVHNRWQARICHCGVRYILGNFDEQADAVTARKKAEKLLRADPDAFVTQYREYPHHPYK